MSSRQFRYQLNTTDQLIFLKSGKVLNDLAWKVIADVNRLLMTTAGLDGQPETMVNETTNRAYFCRFVNNGCRGVVDEKYLHAAAEFVRIESIATAKTRHDLIKILTFKKNNDVRFKHSRGKGDLLPGNYLPSLKMGLTLLLVGLWKRKVVLLPGNIYMPWHPWLDKFPELMSPFVSDISLMLRRFRGDDEFESKIKKSKSSKIAILCFASKHTQFIHASNLYRVDKNLTEDSFSGLWVDYIRAKRMGNRTLPKCPSREDFPAFLAEHFSLSFDLKSFHEKLISQLEDLRIITASASKRARYDAGLKEKTKGRSDWRKIKEPVFANRKLSKIYESMWPSEMVLETSDDYFFRLKEMRDLSQFHPENLKEFWVLAKAPDEVSRAANCWAELQVGFLKKKRLLKANGFQKAFGLFNAYITYYLPVWFAENDGNNFSFPCSPAQLKGVIFIDRPANPVYAVPRTLFELMEHISQRYGNSPNTIKVWIANLKDFFDYVEKYQEMYSDLLGGEAGFHSPIDRADIPRGARLRKTQKNTFASRLFKTLVSYVKALLDVQDQLANKFESGELEINRILEADFISIKELPIRQPLVHHYGKKFEIGKIPNFLHGIRMKNKHGLEETILYPGLLRHNYLMLETGIRGMQLRWLDETTYDRYVDRENRSYAEMLHVNTNKDGSAWISVVASRVIDQLDAQRYWKSRITQEGFHLPCEYSDNYKNYYDEIYPVFSYTLGNGRPFEYEKYSKTWQKILLGFQWFLRLNGLDSVCYVKYLPQGIGLNIENLWNSNLAAVQSEYTRVAKDNIKITDNNDQAEYCPVVLRSLVTPHGARATVISESVQVLSPRIVGEYITGQKERAVLYYNTPDKETMARTLRKQNMMMTAKDGQGFIENVDIDDPVLNECREVNIKIAKAAAEGEAIGRDAGFFSIKACLDSKESRNGLELLNAGKARRLGIHPSHLCAFNDVCPKELVDVWGQTRLCGICSYSINHVMHLPAISAMCDKAWEEYERAKEHYLEFKDRRDVSDDEKNRADQKIIWLCSDALGWELRERALIEKAKKMNNGEDVGELIVERPEDVAAYIDAHHIRTDETDYILKRLRDCIKFPLTDSENIKAKFALAARRILLMEGRVNEALEDRSPATAASELYSLLHTLQEMHGYSHAEIFGLLRTELLDRVNEIQAKPGHSRMRGLEIVNLEVD